MKMCEGMEVWLSSFLASGLDGGEWSASRPGHFTPGETPPVPHCIGGWTLWRREKSLAPAGDGTPTVQYLACRYTDWAVYQIQSW
jgi:hypothetical protein